MGRRSSVRILVVEADRSAWPGIRAFFAAQAAQAGARALVVCRDRLPSRAAGFDLISLTDRLDGRSVAHLLLDRPDLLADLRATPIVNLHAPRPAALHRDMRVLLDREGGGPSPDGLWVVSREWMAPSVGDPLECPELGPALVAEAPTASPDRTWERRSARLSDLPAQSLRAALAPAGR